MILFGNKMIRKHLIIFLKKHSSVQSIFYACLKWLLNKAKLLIPIQKRTILFSSYCGKKFDDSPKAIYEELCRRKEFDEWVFIWVFECPEKFNITRGKKVKLDSLEYFMALLYSQIWVSNCGIDRDLNIKRKETISVETWHGTPIKRIGGEENQSSSSEMVLVKSQKDKQTIRCAQSEYDREIFCRVFNADKDSILLCDLPRNDILTDKHTDDEIIQIKRKLGINNDKKIILYMPTFREYLQDENKMTYMSIPIDLKKWNEKLSEDYILLIRAHYWVKKSLGIIDDGFVIDVSEYQSVNELYLISNIMISDYSSSFVDYSILERPMLCFAYDLEEYERKRGFYLDIKKTFPCPIDRTEDELLEHIINMNEEQSVEKAKTFHMRFAPFAGNASKTIVDEIFRRIDK